MLIIKKKNDFICKWFDFEVFMDKDGSQKRSYLMVIFHMELCTTLNLFFHERKEWAYDYLLIGILISK